MAGNRQILKLTDMVFDTLVKQGIFSIPNAGIASSVIEHKIHSRLVPMLLQAVIDENQTKVAELLEKNPQLLLRKAQNGVEIASQYTWLKIAVENEDALSIAVKRKQVTMIEFILNYYEKLQQTEEVLQAKRNALSAWQAYPMQKNSDGDYEIMLPPEYSNQAQSLITVFSEELFPNGVNETLSEKTEQALTLLLDTLLPKKAIKLDNYLDPELLLLAFHKAYFKQFATFQNWQQRNAFCIRVIGLAQSVVTPEVAKMFCKGFYNYVQGSKKGNVRAELLQLIDGESFYRTSREPLAGLGREYFCGWFEPRALWGGGKGKEGMQLLEYICQGKMNCLTDIKQQLQPQPQPAVVARAPSRCVIL